MRWLKEHYFSLELASLGLFRILFGILLLGELITKTILAPWAIMPNGWTTKENALDISEGNYSSFYISLPSDNWCYFYIILTGICYLLFISGHCGFITKFNTLFYTLNFQNRTVWTLNTAQIIVTLLLLYCLILPVEERFKIKLTNFKNWVKKESRKGSYSSIGCFGVLLLISLIYEINFLAKSGSNWKDYTAVFYAVSLGSHQSAFGIWMQHFIPGWGFKVLTFGASTIEGLIPFLIMSPIYTSFTRILSVILEVCLHFGITLSIIIGIFGPLMMIVPTLILPRKVWGYVEKW